MLNILLWEVGGDENGEEDGERDVDSDIAVDGEINITKKKCLKKY